MKKKLALLLVVVLSLLMLAGCGGGAKQSDSGSSKQGSSQEAKKQEKSKPQDLVIEEFAYTNNDGYIDYVIKVTNPNEKFRAEYGNLTITDTASDGSIRFSDDTSIGICWPKSTTYWVGMAGDGDAADDDKLEAKLSVDEYNWIPSATQVPEDLYTFENVTVKANEYDELKATGTVTVKADAGDIEKEIQKSSGSTLKKPQIVCILKDADGKIVGGFEGSMNSDLQPGSASPFDISSYGNVPEYATAEMYANPW